MPPFASTFLFLCASVEIIPCHYELTFATILHKTLLKTKTEDTVNSNQKTLM
jgi:hypothetical protein